jgi:hypothetical protein
MKEWNPNDFQGRSRDKVERYYRVLAIIIVLGCLLTTWFVIYNLIDYIF